MQKFLDLKSRENRQKFYNSKEWRAIRKMILEKNPLCVNCKKNNRIVVATEVDHIIGLELNPDLALVSSNLQGLCKSCHSSKTWEENNLFKYPYKLYNRKWNIDKYLSDI